jgi:ABC-type transport system involved in cytochrome c biogenesis permease subunit
MPDLRVTQQHLEHDAYLYIRQSKFWRTRRARNASMPCVTVLWHWAGRSNVST